MVEGTGRGDFDENLAEVGIGYRVKLVPLAYVWPRVAEVTMPIVVDIKACDRMLQFFACGCDPSITTAAAAPIRVQDGAEVVVLKVHHVEFGVTQVYVVKDVVGQRLVLV